MGSSDQTVLQFAPSSKTLSARVHPLVIFNICDFYVRRPDQAERIIGTLLGSVLRDGTVDIRNSYAVPHSESQDQFFVFSSSHTKSNGIIKMASSDQAVLQFSPSSATLSAKVHSLVIFNIFDCYVRRPDQVERIIGTLLGSVLPDGTIDIRNSYAVPHSESQDQVALDIDYHHNMLSSHQKVNPKEAIVGWFSTGFGVSGGSALIQEFYSRETSNPIHLTVDTGFQNGEASIKGFVSVHLSLGDQPLAAQFQEIPLDLRMVEAERVGFDMLKTTTVDKLPNDLEGMEASMGRLLALIDDVHKYVDDVVEGRLPQDNKTGRFIADTVATIPKLSPQAFDKLVNDGLQDQLLLLYLASLARTQLSFAEKLNTAAQIL